MWRFNYTYTVELRHYGVKGMKWGVRRTPEQLGHKNSIAKQIKNGIIKVVSANGIRIRKMSKHQIDRANERGLSEHDIVDALIKPLEIKDVITDKDGRSSQRFIGRSATVNVNPETGIIVTTWKTSSKLVEKLERNKK